MRIARIQAEIQISLYCATHWKIDNFDARSFEIACEIKSNKMEKLNEQKTEQSFFA